MEVTASLMSLLLCRDASDLLPMSVVIELRAVIDFASAWSALWSVRSNLSAICVQRVAASVWL